MNLPVSLQFEGGGLAPFDEDICHVQRIGFVGREFDHLVAQQRHRQRSDIRRPLHRTGPQHSLCVCAGGGVGLLALAWGAEAGGW
jgi:hypothetical protein